MIEFQTLGCMHRHQPHLTGRFIILAIGQQENMLQKFIQTTALLAVPDPPAAQFHDIRQATFLLLFILGFVPNRLLQPAVFQQHIKRIIRLAMAKGMFQLHHQQCKLAQFFSPAVYQFIMQTGLQQGTAMYRGKQAQITQRTITDTAPGFGNGTHKGQVIAGIADQTQIGQHGLDLSTIEKRHAATDMIRDALFAQGHLHGPRLE